MCLTVLCQLDDSLEEAKIQNFPLALYAAEHWFDHARFEDGSSDIQDAMDYFFAKDKPHLAAWLWLYDIEVGRMRWHYHAPHPTPPDAVPLYYAALCGLHNLSGRLLDAHPEDVNVKARGSYHVTPLLASLNRGHPDIALLLLERGADMESRGYWDQTALYVASSCGYAEVVQSLIDRGADLNMECGDEDDGWFKVKWTPLHVASNNGRLDVARLLLEHGAGVNYQDNWGRIALHIASRQHSNNLVRLLLDHGANLYALDYREYTALHDASSYGRVTIVKSLLEYGANVDAQSRFGRTPLQSAAMAGHSEVTQLLLDHGADVNVQMEENRRTALHMAALRGHVQVVEVLLKRGADPHARSRLGQTPFQFASPSWPWGPSSPNNTQILRLLSEHTGEKM
jgi:ankyrin repeat protein